MLGMTGNFGNFTTRLTNLVKSVRVTKNSGLGQGHCDGCAIRAQYRDQP